MLACSGIQPLSYSSGHCEDIKAQQNVTVRVQPPGQADNKGVMALWQPNDLQTRILEILWKSSCAWPESNMCVLPLISQTPSPSHSPTPTPLLTLHPKSCLRPPTSHPTHPCCHPTTSILYTTLQSSHPSLTLLWPSPIPSSPSLQMESTI